MERNYARPVIFETNDCYHLAATGFFFSFKGNNYFVTARHILKNNSYTYEQLRVPVDPWKNSMNFIHLGYGKVLENDKDDNTDYYDFMIFDVDDEKSLSELNQCALPLQRLNDEDFCVGTSQDIVIIGFPTCLVDYSNVNVNVNMVQYTYGILKVTEISPFFPGKKYSECAEWRVKVNTNEKIGEYNGFSGAPVLLFRPQEEPRILGMVVRGEAETHTMNFIRAELFILKFLAEVKNVPSLPRSM